MKFINGKVFGSRQGLTRLPGIGQMYALRLEAVGYNQVIQLLQVLEANNLVFLN